MESCRTCRFASIVKQQCQKRPPKPFVVMSPNGPMTLSVFPPIVSYPGCGEHEPCGADELERREREHPVTTREVGADAGETAGPKLVS
jgi:hypothetical protein